MSIINVKDLCKSFSVGQQKVEVLKNINFSVSEGEFVSIMGPSGVGKSTLLYLLGGLDKQTSGKIVIAGENISGLSASKLAKFRRSSIGFVFQFYNLIPNLSVTDNILLPLVLDGQNTTKYKDNFDELVELMGIQDKLNVTPRELSGGQQQRIAIARALIYEPDILLLDEPTGNLDSVNTKSIMEMFKKINMEMKKTIIQVTHSEDSALYGTKIFKMLDGEINSIQEISSLSECVSSLVNQ